VQKKSDCGRNSIKIKKMKESIIDVIVSFSPILAPRLSASQVEISRGFIADFPLHGAVFPVFSPFFYICFFDLWRQRSAKNRKVKTLVASTFGRPAAPQVGEIKLKILPDLVVTLWQAAARG